MALQNSQKIISLLAGLKTGNLFEIEFIEFSSCYCIYFDFLQFFFILAKNSGKCSVIYLLLFLGNMYAFFLSFSINELT